MALLKRRSSLDSIMYLLSTMRYIHILQKYSYCRTFFSPHRMKYSMYILRELMKIERPSITTFLGYYAVLQGH